MSGINVITTNNYTIKDSFDAVNKIKCVPSKISGEGYSTGLQSLL